MQRRHFESIARVVASIEDDATRREVAIRFADELSSINENFKRDLFLKVCGIR